MADTDNKIEEHSFEVNLEKMNDRSLEILADIWDPYFELMRDKKFAKLYATNLHEAIKYACKNHKKQVIEIAAVLEGKSIDEYVVNPFKLPITLITAIGAYSKVSKDLFTSQDQSKEIASSGPATENTEAEEQPKDS